MLQKSTHWRRTKSMFFDLRRSPTAFAEKVSVVVAIFVREIRERGTDWESFERQIQFVDDVGVVEEGFLSDIFGC